ncbi:hypothetical protein B0J13DRAFT_572417 [Dactylonectria estremocensis]|uniref:Uncharacterized protein n=1 Tax=Dactylonectria estremocensis TaxID=1079267 RepID=A0A9P9DAF5_9HYPO|nr:hypothetical protein B0J13DRAFT_572417 [Dactylonectria estremocensis]
MAFLISVLIVLSTAHGSLHLQLVASFAAVSFAISNLILEIIFWEWYQPPMPRYLVIPLPFIAFFIPATIFANVYTAPVDDSVPFYELCYDFGAANRVTSTLHEIVVASQPLAVFMLLLWCRLRWKLQRYLRQKLQPSRGLKFLERTAQSITLVLLLLGLAAVLYTFAEYRTIAAAQTGSLNEERVWSFGQIVPLATWIPVLIEFVHILASRDGLATGLARKVPEGRRSVENTTSPLAL